MQCMLRLVAPDGFALEGMQPLYMSLLTQRCLMHTLQAVISAVEQVSPSVVNIEGARQ